MIRMLGMLLVFFAMCFNFAVAYRSVYKRHICFTIYHCSLGICMMMWLAVLSLRYIV